MTIFMVDNGDTFEGTATQADDCFGISRDIEDWSDKQVMEVLSSIFPDSTVSIKSEARG